MRGSGRGEPESAQVAPLVRLEVVLETLAGVECDDIADERHIAGLLLQIDPEFIAPAERFEVLECLALTRGQPGHIVEALGAFDVLADVVEGLIETLEYSICPLQERSEGWQREVVSSHLRAARVPERPMRWRCIYNR